MLEGYLTPKTLRYFIFGVFFLVFSFPSSASNSAWHFVKMSADHFGTFSSKLAAVCNYDRAVLSPASEYMTFERRELLPTSLVALSQNFEVADMNCVAEQGLSPRCMTHLEGLEGIRPFSWQPADKGLFTISDKKRLTFFRFERDGLLRRPILVNEELIGSDAATTAVSMDVTHSSGARDEARKVLDGRNHATLDSKLGITLLAYAVANGGLVGQIGFDNSNLSVLVDIDNSKRKTGLVRPYLIQGDFAYDHSHLPVFYTAGASVLLRPEKITVRSEASLSRAAIDSSTGSIAARYTPRNVKSELSQFGIRQSILEINRIILEYPNALISDLSFARGGLDFVLTLADVEGKPMFIIKRGISRYGYQCPGFNSARVAIKFTKVGPPSWPVQLLRLTLSHSKGVAVLFRGGPGASIDNPSQLSSAQRFLKAGWSVIVAGYSGTVGATPATMLRVSKAGPHAFSRDASIIAGFLRSTRGPIIIQGESFGATPALALNALLPSRPGGLILAAPYLKPRKPSADILNNDLSQGSVEYQKTWERILIGLANAKDRNRFYQNANQLAEEGSASRKTLIIQGRRDLVSRIGDVPRIIRSKALYQSVDQVHQSVLQDPKSIKSIDRFISNY